MSVHAPLKVVDTKLNDVILQTEDPSIEWEGLHQNSLRRFGVRQNSQGTYFPYYRNNGLCGFKVRKHEASHTDRFFACGDMKDAELFGQRLAGSHKYLVLTEGEKDCISAWQMSGDSYDVVSIPTGATVKPDGTGVIDKGVKAQESFLRKYERIYLCLDQDEAGAAVST